MKKLLVALMLTHIFNYGFSQTIISDLRPGMDESIINQEQINTMGDEIYFTAIELGIGYCLYKTDGHTITRLDGDPSQFQMYNLIGVMQNELYYFKYQQDGTSLYKTAGEVGDSELIYSFNTNSITLTKTHRIVVDDVMYFYAFEENTGDELWRTDGTTAGTYLVKDIYPGPSSSLTLLAHQLDRYFEELNGIVYFSALDGVNGSELWRSDGTEAGTYMVKDIEPITNSSIEYYGGNPMFLTKFNNNIYFSAYRSVDGSELWKTDGTEAGTVLVKDIASASSQPSYLIVYNQHLYFVATDQTHGSTLFKSDGTSAGTSIVKAPNAGGPVSPNELYIFKNKLFFVANSELWMSNGTAAGTMKLTNPSSYSEAYPTLYPTTNYLYFFGSDGTYNDYIYRTTDVNNTFERLTNAGFDYASDVVLNLVNNCLVFTADNGNTGLELYKVCNQNSQPLEIEEVQNTTIDIFPNPCVDQIQLKVNFNLSEINSIQLISLEGSETQVDFKMKSESVIQINGLNQFSRGIYFLNVITESGNKLTQKVVIQ